MKTTNLDRSRIHLVTNERPPSSSQEITRGRERRYVAVVHARSVADRVVDAELIRSECVAQIADYVAAPPEIDVIAAHCTPNTFVAIELTTARPSRRAQRALDAACDHVIAHAARYGLAKPHRATALTGLIEPVELLRE
jgi:hypothetical protein